jgi:site-specific DNA-cytosine methylase
MSKDNINLNKDKKENKMKVLELFSGTHSVGKVCKEKGYEVISVDINDYKGKYPPTHKVDILKFDYKKYNKDDFDIIWASPPCVYYSILQNSWIGRQRRDKEGKLYTFTKKHLEDNMKISDEWVKKTLEIINYFNPRLWFMENPKTGRMKSRDFMKDLQYYDVDYCMYCDWGYKKPTRIWTNKKDFKPLVCNKKCNNMKDGKHIKRLGGFRKKTTKLDRYRIPPNLIKSLLN